MKNPTLVFILVFAFIGFSTSSFAQSYKMLNHGYYAHGTIYSKGASYWKYYIPANELGVFTLKNKGYASDLDLFIYSSSSRSYRLAAGEKSGRSTELVTISGGDYGKYVYLKVLNYGDASTKFHLYAHQVNYGEMLADALITAGIQSLAENLLCWLADADCKNNSSNARNAERAAGIAVSALKGESLGSMAKSALISEVTASIRDQLGYGFWADFGVNYAVGLVQEIYMNY